MVDFTPADCIHDDGKLRLNYDLAVKQGLNKATVEIIRQLQMLRVRVHTAAPKLGFVHLSEAWYGKTCLGNPCGYKDEIMFGLYHKDGSTQGEMAMRWIDINNAFHDEKYIPRLEVFDDAWAVLTMIPNVLAELGNLNGQNITPKEFVQVLLDQGFTDMTPRKNPYH